MHLIRFIFYIGVVFAIGLIFGPRRLETFPDLGPLLALPLIGILGVASLIWARIATSLWPIRFDPDQDVIEIQFRQAPYATRFRVMNREATSAQNTEETPWYKRALLWKVIVLVLFFMFMARLMK